jgi:hypothetical protein
MDIVKARYVDFARRGGQEADEPHDLTISRETLQG